MIPRLTSGPHTHPCVRACTDTCTCVHTQNMNEHMHVCAHSHPTHIRYKGKVTYGDHHTQSELSSSSSPWGRTHIFTTSATQASLSGASEILSLRTPPLKIVLQWGEEVLLSNKNESNTTFSPTWKQQESVWERNKGHQRP